MNKKIISILFFAFILFIALNASAAEIAYESASVGRITGDSIEELETGLTKDNLNLQHSTFLYNLYDYDQELTQPYQKIQDITSLGFPNNNQTSGLWNWNDAKNMMQNWKKNELFLLYTEGEFYNNKLRLSDAIQLPLNGWLYAQGAGQWSPEFEVNSPLFVSDAHFSGLYLPKSFEGTSSFTGQLGDKSVIIAPTATPNFEFMVALVCTLAKEGNGAHELGEIYKDARNNYYWGANKPSGLALMSYSLLGDPTLKTTIPNPLTDEILKQYCDDFLGEGGPTGAPPNGPAGAPPTGPPGPPENPPEGIYTLDYDFDFSNYEVKHSEDFSWIEIPATNLAKEYYELALPRKVNVSEFPLRTVVRNVILTSLSEPDYLLLENLPAWDQNFVERKCNEDTKEAGISFSPSFTADKELIIVTIDPVEVVDCNSGAIKLYKKISYQIQYLPYSPVLIESVEHSEETLPNADMEITANLRNMETDAVSGTLRLSDGENTITEQEINFSSGSGPMQTVFSDDFSDNDYENNPPWIVTEGGYKATNGYLETTSSTGSSTAHTSLEISDKTEISITARFYLSNLNPGVGLAIGNTPLLDDGLFDGYILYLNRQIFTLRRFDDSVNTDVIKQEMTNSTDTWYSVEATRNVSGVWEIKLDGEGKGTAHDNNYNSFLYTVSYTAHYDGTNGSGIDDINIQSAVGTGEPADQNKEVKLNFKAPNEEKIENYKLEFLQDEDPKTFAEFPVKIEMLGADLIIPEIIVGNTAIVGVSLNNKTLGDLNLTLNYYLIKNNNTLQNGEIMQVLEPENNLIEFSYNNLKKEDQSYEVLVTLVYDNRLKSLSDSIVTNHYPILAHIPDIEVNEGGLVEIIPQVTDLDNDNITVQISDPIGDDGFWETTFDDAGEYTVTVTVGDGLLQDSQDVNIVVYNVNRPPVINDYFPQDLNMILNENGSQLFSVQVSDPDNDELTTSWFLDGNFVQEGLQYELFASELPIGFHEVKAEVSDNDLKVSNLWNVEITKGGLSAGELCELSFDCISGYCEGSVSNPKRCCASQPTADGWYDGGNTTGCGTDPSSQNKDYYCDSSGTAQYETTGTFNCDTQDDCGSSCPALNERKDYYVVLNTSTCTYNVFDADNSQSNCTSCMGNNYWNLGGDIGQCCSDDTGENVKTRICEVNACISDQNDDACCTATSKCVYNSLCYNDQQILDVDNDTQLEACSNGVWKLVEISAPELYSPDNNSVHINAASLYFDWSDIPYATKYKLTIFHPVHGTFIFNPTESQYLLQGDEWSSLKDGTYTWKVSAFVNDEEGPASEERSFTKLTTPALLFPADGTKYAYRIETLHVTWEDTGAEKYKLKIILLNGMPFEQEIAGTEYAIPSDLWNILKDGTYKWSAASIVGSHASPYSEEWHLTKDTIPVLLSPYNGAELDSPPVTFDWADIENADFYKARATIPGNPVPIEFQLPPGQSYFTIYEPGWNNLPNGEYTWQIKSVKGTKESNYSGAWTFKKIG